MKKTISKDVLKDILELADNPEQYKTREELIEQLNLIKDVCFGYLG